jgi:hypothetical protein
VLPPRDFESRASTNSAIPAIHATLLEGVERQSPLQRRSRYQQLR